MSLVAAVLGINTALLAAGYGVLAPALAGRPRIEWASYAGLALLVGAGLVGVAVFAAAVLGTTTGPVTFGLAAAVVAAIGFAAARSRQTRTWLAAPRPRAGHQDVRAREHAIATAARFGVVAVCACAVLGGFRSSPWLDDAWGIWLPKGIALAEHGLDGRLFVPNGRYVSFEVPDYPLWWSALTGLDARLTGDLDVRAMNAQLALLAVGFVAAVARLLWGHVRPWILWTGLLLLVASPEFWRHSQSGMADLPLAIYLSLFLAVGAQWLLSGRPFFLILAGVFAATALAVKTEGLPLLVAFIAVVSVFAIRRQPRRLAGLWAATGVGFLAFVPWLAWRATNGIGGRVPLTDALDPAYLGDRTGRIGPAVDALAEHLLDPREWLVVVPLAVALSLAGAVRARDALRLAPFALLASGFCFWVWAYWADRDELSYLLATSSYRVVDVLVLLAAVAVPVQAELLARRP